MRLAKSSVTLMAALALIAWVSIPARSHAAQPGKSPQPSKQAAKTPAAPSPTTQAPAKAQAPAPKAPAPGAAAGKPAGPSKQSAKTAAGQSSKTAKGAKSARGAKTAPKIQPVKATEPVHVARRDPFNPLVGKDPLGGASVQVLPPGKAGLVVSTLRLDGIVRGPNGMIAVVSNPQQRTYFLRDGDQLYDGKVEKITMESVAFHESGKDAFGKPVERQVIKRLYSSPGEQR